MSEKKDALPTILMFELDDDTRPILKQNLSGWGYGVVVALKEEDAITLARGWQTVDESPAQSLPSLGVSFGSPRHIP